MTIIVCIAICCATALAGLRMYLTAQRPQVTRAEIEEMEKKLADEARFLRNEMATVERKLVEWGIRLTSVEKLSKLRAAAEPVFKRAAAEGGGPMTRTERRAAAEPAKAG